MSTIIFVAIITLAATLLTMTFPISGHPVGEHLLCACSVRDVLLGAYVYYII